MELNLLQFGERFYTQYKPHFGLKGFYNDLMGDPEAYYAHYMHYLGIEEDTATSRTTIFMIDGCISNLIEHAVIHQPEQLENPLFIDKLVAICAGLVASND